MTQQHPINSLIRQIANRNDVQENEYRKIIAFDLNSKQAIDPPSFTLFGKYDYYVTDTSETPTQKLGDILVEDAIAKCKVPISIEYSVSSDKDRAYQLVKACHGNGDPGNYVDGIVLKSVKSFEREHKEDRRPLLDDNNEWRDKLKTRISTDLNRIGLDVRMVEIGLVRRHSDEPIAASWTVESPLLDLFDDEKAIIKLNARIEVDDSRHLDFMLDDRGPEGLKKDIGSWTKEFFDLNVSISQLQPGEHKAIEHKLKEELKTRLAGRGRRLVNLEIDVKPPFELPVAQETIKHSVSCTVKDRDTPVTVDNQLLVCLKDWKRWKKHCGQDPKPILRDAIEHATSRVLFNMSYLELIKAFNLPGKSDGQPQLGNRAIQAIKERVSEKAEHIGYEVEQLVSLPNVPVVILKRDGLTYSLEDEVPLQDNRIKGKINVRLFAQLPDLSEIEAYLRDDDLERKVSQDVRRQIERVLARTTPHRFHMQFAIQDGQPSVTEDLKTEIKNKLIEEYKLQNIEISIVMGDTDLLKRFRQLARGLQEAKAQIVVGRGELGEAAIGEFGAESIPFTIRYSIEGIDGDDESSWFRFQARDYDPQQPNDEITAINEVLADEFFRIMDQLPAALIRSTEFQRNDTQNRIKELLQDKIVKDFGIAISVSSVTRRDAPSDQMLLDIGESYRKTQKSLIEEAGNERANHAEAATKSLRELREEQRKLIKQDPDDPRIEGLNQRIAEFEESVRVEGSQAAALAAPRKAPALPTDRKADMSIKEHLELLSGSANNVQKLTDDAHHRADEQDEPVSDNK